MLDISRRCFEFASASRQRAILAYMGYRLAFARLRSGKQRGKPGTDFGVLPLENYSLDGKTLVRAFRFRTRLGKLRFLTVTADGKTVRSKWRRRE